MQASRSEPKEVTVMTQLDHIAAMEELDYRESDGIAVSLLWSRHSNRLRVLVEDRKTGESFALPARADNALAVFHHPYAYAPAQLYVAA
jgi:hypothetical protein